MHNGHVSVKEAVLPFARFAGADSVLGPEMKSHRRGDGDRGRLPDGLRQGPGRRRRRAADRGHGLHHASPTPTRRPRPSSRPASTTSASRSSPPPGTAQAISRMGVPVRAINKIGEGSPHVVDYIRNGEVDLVINTPTGSGARSDGYEIRNAAVRQGIPCMTTMTGASAAARAISAARSRSDAGADLAAGAARDRGEPRAAPSAKRLTGARARAVRPAAAARSRANEATGGYRIFSALDREGPSPRAGQFYMLATRALGRRGGRAAVPAARLLGRRPRRETEGGVRLDFLLEAVGPGTGAARRARAGRGLLELTGRSAARSRARRARAGQRRRDPGRRRDRDRAAGDPAPRARRGRDPAARPARLPRPRARRRAWTSSSCEEIRLASEDGHAGHRGYVTDLLAVLLEGDDAGERRRLRLRPAGDARGGARDVRGARRRCRAGDGGADGLRLRRLLRLRGAARGRRLHAPLRRRAGRPRATRSRRRSWPDRGTDERRGRPQHRALRARARAPDHQRLRDLRRDRRAAGLRRRGSTRFPFSAFVSKTITPEPRAGNPPPRLYETPAGMINSIGLPNKGLARLPRARPARARRAAGAADRLGDGDEPRGVRARWSTASAAATRWPRSSSTSPARTSSRG